MAAETTDYDRDRTPDPIFGGSLDRLASLGPDPGRDVPRGGGGSDPAVTIRLPRAVGSLGGMETLGLRPPETRGKDPP